MHTYRLIKLRARTVRSLKRLNAEIGLNSLDALINTMIRITNEHRLVFKDSGWIVQHPDKKLLRGM
jgi:hypothetical protein